MTEPEQPQQDGSTAALARETLVRALVVYGVQALIMVGMVAAIKYRPLIEMHARRLLRRRTARHDAVMAEWRRLLPGVRNDIRRFERGEGALDEQ